MGMFASYVSAWHIEDHEISFYLKWNMSRRLAKGQRSPEIRHQGKGMDGYSAHPRTTCSHLTLFSRTRHDRDCPSFGPDVTYYVGRIRGHDRVRRHISGDNRSRAHHTPPPDRHA